MGRGNSGNEQSWQVVNDFSGRIEVDGDAAAEVASDCREGREMADERWRKEGLFSSRLKVHSSRQWLRRKEAGARLGRGQPDERQQQQLREEMKYGTECKIVCSNYFSDMGNVHLVMICDQPDDKSPQY
jgi:hypothetical protein